MDGPLTVSHCLLFLPKHIDTFWQKKAIDFMMMLLETAVRAGNVTVRFSSKSA